MLFAGWEVRMVKTVTEVLKILPEAVGRGQRFQDRGHSFHHTDRPLAGK